MTHTPDELFLHADHRDLLEGTLELMTSGDLPERPDLRRAINSLLTRRPSVADCNEVIHHLRNDDFDYESGTASDAAIAIEAYREELFLDV